MQVRSPYQLVLDSVIKSNKIREISTYFTTNTAFMSLYYTRTYSRAGKMLKEVRFEMSYDRYSFDHRIEKHFIYDNKGNKIKQFEVNGKGDTSDVFTFEYDSSGTVTKKCGEEFMFIFKNEYNSAGQLIRQIEEIEGVQNFLARQVNLYHLFTYDSAGRLTSYRALYNDNKSVYETVRYGYDSKGRLSTITKSGTYESGKEMSTVLDYGANGKLCQVTEPRESPQYISYLKNGLVRYRFFPNNSQRHWYWNEYKFYK